MTLNPATCPGVVPDPFLAAAALGASCGVLTPSVITTMRRCWDRGTAASLTAPALRPSPISSGRWRELSRRSRSGGGDRSRLGTAVRTPIATCPNPRRCGMASRRHCCGPPPGRIFRVQAEYDPQHSPKVELLGFPPVVSNETDERRIRCRNRRSPFGDTPRFRQRCAWRSPFFLCPPAMIPKLRRHHPRRLAKRLRHRPAAHGWTARMTAIPPHGWPDGRGMGPTPCGIALCWTVRRTGTSNPRA